MATCLCTGSCWRCRPLAVRLGSQAHRARNCKRLLSQEKEVSACACAREAVGCGRAREQGEKGRESGATSSQPPRRALLGHAALLVERRVAGGHHLKGGPWRRRGCLRRGPRRRRGLPPHAHETGKVLGRSRWLSRRQGPMPATASPRGPAESFATGGIAGAQERRGAKRAKHHLND